MRGVWFAYPGGTAVLRNLDLDIGAGQWVCVVGPTGAGKSTLLNLLLRFYDPTAGTVELDGVALDKLSLASLRSQLALVPQDPWMLDGTIAENIAFGRPGAGEAAVRSAGALALVDEFADRLPDGWDTVVGEGGVRLSGGQRRRVALARALLRDAAVLLLDEPTSGLDAASEDEVLRALDKAVRGRTVVTVSHQLALAARADRVVVLHGGRVVEQGPHQELLTQDGHYAGLWALQQSSGSPLAAEATTERG
jgi:ATP-binding cassette, subfamily B, bacterial